MKITQEDVQRYVAGDPIDPELELAIQLAVEQDGEVAEWYREAVGQEDEYELGVAAIRASLDTIDQSLWIPLSGDNALAPGTPQNGTVSWTPEQTGRFTLEQVDGKDLRLTFDKLPDGWKPASLVVFHKQAIAATLHSEHATTVRPLQQTGERASSRSVKSLAAQKLRADKQDSQPSKKSNQRCLQRSNGPVQTWFTTDRIGRIELHVSIIVRGLLTAPAIYRLQIAGKPEPFTGEIPLRPAPPSQLVERLQDDQDDEAREWLRSSQTQAQVDDESAAAERDEFIAGLEDIASKEPWLRVECARGLGYIGGDEARGALVRRLNDEGEAGDVRIACAETLGALAGEAERDALLAWWEAHPLNDETSGNSAELQTAVQRALFRCAELYVGKQQLIGLIGEDLNTAQWTLHVDVAALGRVTLNSTQFRQLQKPHMTVIPLHEATGGAIFDGLPRALQRDLCFSPDACRVVQVEVPLQ